MTELETIRDFLRYAVSRFRAAKLVHGHGTTRVIDEAAFIVLEALHLPVHDINPWLDAKLTQPEREKLFSLIEERISTRKPAAYLLKKTYMHGVPFYVDERVIIPRSYIGELLANGLLSPEGESLVAKPEKVKNILDLCTGSACLAILASNVFPDAEIDATDLSPGALDVAKINVTDHDVADQIKLHYGSLFEPVAEKKYDLVIANPPYVAKIEVDSFPPEYTAEPVMAHLGGDDGLDIVRDIIRNAPKHMNKGGLLICEIGTGKDILEKDFPKTDFFWVDTEESEGEVFLLRY